MKKIRIIAPLLLISSSATIATSCGISSTYKIVSVPFYNFYFNDFTTPVFNLDLALIGGIDSIPYIDFMDMVDIQNSLQGREENLPEIIYENNLVSYIYTFPKINQFCEPLQTKVVFDFKENKIYTKNLFGVRASDNSIAPLDMFTFSEYIPDFKMGSTEVNYLTTTNSNNRTGGYGFTESDDRTIDLNKYNIKIYHFANDKYYIPLQLASDLFFAYTYSPILYNGRGAYITYNGYSAKEGAVEFIRRNGRSYREESFKALQEFSYHEFCLNMDVNYGLKDTHRIVSFDEYLTNRGLKDLMLNEHEDSALGRLTWTYFDDHHSGFTHDGNFYEPYDRIYINKEVQSYIGPDYVRRMYIEEQIQEAAIQSGYFYHDYQYDIDVPLFPTFQILPEPVSEVLQNDSTIFIKFDAFNFLASFYGDINYYTIVKGFEEGNPTMTDMLYNLASSGDTILLMYYALEVANNNKDKIKNIVLDLTMNGGGAVDAAAFVIYSFLGEMSTMNSYCSFDNGSSIIPFYADCNFDHIIDDDDHFDLNAVNLYCLTSEISFSCGNLVPSAFKDSGKVTLIGQTSGGGSCMVLPTSTSLGASLQISGPVNVCSFKNGNLKPIDEGVNPDMYLTYSQLYSDGTKSYYPSGDYTHAREYLLKILNEQKIVEI